MLPQGAFPFLASPVLLTVARLLPLFPSVCPPSIPPSASSPTRNAEHRDTKAVTLWIPLLSSASFPHPRHIPYAYRR